MGHDKVSSSAVHSARELTAQECVTAEKALWMVSPLTTLILY